MTKTKKTMIHPLDGQQPQQPTETTHLMSPKHHNPNHPNNSKELSYMLVFFFMLNRSINLVMYKALTTFSYFFSQYFQMNYTLFAIVAIMNFPGNLCNMACVPLYARYRIKYVMIFFELLLALSCALIVPFHYLAGLLLCRLVTGFAVTAIRTEVNATIGAYTIDERRTNAISIIEFSFALSSAGFLLVGIVLHWLGWQIFFLGTAGIILFITVLIMIFVPNWYLSFRSGSQEEEKFESKKKNAYSTKMLSECLHHKRLIGVFATIVLNKIARNAFYYTFSKWLAEDYGLNVQQTGFVTLTMAAGHFCGSAISPLLVNGMNLKIFGLRFHIFRIGIYGGCIAGAMLQVLSMCVEPGFKYFGQMTPLIGACAVVFSYFCGCQLWYNNLLDICFSVTPRRNLFPAVQTILLACGSLGGSIGTIGSTFWYNWGNEVAIALICAFCNVLIVMITFVLYAHYRENRKLLQSDKKEDQLRAKGKYITKPLKKEDKERVTDEYDASTMVIVTSNDILAPTPNATNTSINNNNSGFNTINNNNGGNKEQQRDCVSLSQASKLSDSLQGYLTHSKTDNEQNEQNEQNVMNRLLQHEKSSDEMEYQLLKTNFTKLDIEFPVGITVESRFNYSSNDNNSNLVNSYNSMNNREFRSVSVQTSPILNDLISNNEMDVESEVGEESSEKNSKKIMYSKNKNKNRNRKKQHGKKRKNSNDIERENDRSNINTTKNMTEDEKIETERMNKNKNKNENSSNNQNNRNKDGKGVGTAARSTEEDDTTGEPRAYSNGTNRIDNNSIESATDSLDSKESKDEENHKSENNNSTNSDDSE